MIACHVLALQQTERSIDSKSAALYSNCLTQQHLVGIGCCVTVASAFLPCQERSMSWWVLLKHVFMLQSGQALHIQY